MNKFMFETSEGVVECSIDTNKPCISSDPKFPNYIFSEGEVTVLEGKEYLDKLYRWDSLHFTKGWVQVELDDGYYGCPEYRVEFIN